MRQHLVSAAFLLTCVRPYPDPRVSYCPPPLSAREGPFSPICASAIQSFFRSERQLLFPSRHPLHPDPRVSHTIPASARQVPLCPFLARQTFFARHSPCARPQLLFALPRVRYPLTRGSRQLPFALAPLRTSAATIPPSRVRTPYRSVRQLYPSARHPSRASANMLPSRSASAFPRTVASGSLPCQASGLLLCVRPSCPDPRDYPPFLAIRASAAHPGQVLRVAAIPGPLIPIRVSAHYPRFPPLVPFLCASD